MDLVEKVVFAYLGTMGFSIIFNGKIKDCIRCGFIGAVGWLVYGILKDIYAVDSMAANFYAILVVAFFSEVFARIYKEPVTVYIIPGIICFVPGYGIYNTMSYIMSSQYDMAFRSFLDTLLLAWLIAMAMLIISTIFRIFTKVNKR